jgi:hypothetical protein
MSPNQDPAPPEPGDGWKEVMPDGSKRDADPKLYAPDWSRKCEVCSATPIVPVTGMCGPCTFGEAETAGGNW